MTKRQFSPCKYCGGWVYQELDRQESFDILAHRCLNCSREQDSKILIVKNKRYDRDKELTDGFQDK